MFPVTQLPIEPGGTESPVVHKGYAYTFWQYTVQCFLGNSG